MHAKIIVLVFQLFVTVNHVKSDNIGEDEMEKARQKRLTDDTEKILSSINDLRTTMFSLNTDLKKQIAAICGPKTTCVSKSNKKYPCLTPLQYLGCYSDKKRSRDLAVQVKLDNSKDDKLKQCAAACFEKGYKYIGLQGNLCFCGDEYGKYGKTNKCNIECNCETDKQCGGKLRNSVYALNCTSYLGCYTDDINDRDLEHNIWSGVPPVAPGGNTKAKCYDQCKEKDYKYMGLQFGWDCWCDNDYGKHGRQLDTACNSPCSGDKDHFCGGHRRNDVYAINL